MAYGFKSPSYCRLQLTALINKPSQSGQVHLCSHHLNRLYLYVELKSNSNTLLSSLDLCYQLSQPQPQLSSLWSHSIDHRLACRSWLGSVVYHTKNIQYCTQMLQTTMGSNSRMVNSSSQSHLISNLVKTRTFTQQSTCMHHLAFFVISCNLDSIYTTTPTSQSDKQPWLTNETLPRC